MKKRNTKIRILAIFLVLVTSLLAVSISLGGCEKIQGLFAPNSYLPHSTPEEQGMDSQVLLELLNFTDRLQGNLHILLIVRNGKIVLEVYYPPFGPQDKHMLFSATKSFVSAVVGVAIEDGKIQSVDQPVLDYFPDGTLENPDESKQEIHLHDLLNMTSGLLADDDEMGESENWSAFTLNQPMVTEPGGVFDYNSGNSHLLSEVVQKTAGMTTFEYAQEKLFGPLGIKNVFWDADPSGVTQGGIGLMLTPRDMAKLGVLYLDQGKWHGKQVVPASWIEASTQRNENEYAYQWWQNENGFTALGHAGQFIYVIPAQDIVMVTTAALPGTTFLDPVYFVDMILLAVKSDEPLPKSAAEQELAERIEEIANPLAKEVPEFPQMAASIEGKILILDENPGGWKTARLDFEGDQAWLIVTTDAYPEERKFAIGLDGIYRKTEQKALINPGIAEHEKRTFLNPYELNFLLGMPIDGAVAMKGEWTYKDEFTLTAQDLRDYDREMLSFRFTSPDVLIIWRSHMDGSILSVRGKIE